MAETLAIAYAYGRYGLYALRINRRAGSGGDPAEMDLDQEAGLTLRYGNMQTAYARALMGSQLDVELYDGAEQLGGLFGGRFTDTDYEVVLTGPNGRGGTISWSGIPMPGALDQTAAPLVAGQDARTALSAQCGLGRAADVGGPAGEDLVVAQLLQRLQALNPLPVLAGLSLWPTNAPGAASDRLLTRLAFTDNVAGDGAGDYGSLEDQLLAYARNAGVCVFQSLTGFWMALPRHRIGRTQAVTRIVNANEIDAQSLAANTVEAEGLGDDGRVGRVRQLGAVEFASTQGGDLVTDGPFRYRAATGGPMFWERSPTSARPEALGPGQTLTQRLVRVGTAPDLFVEVEMEQDWKTYDDGPLTFYEAPADLQLYVATESGEPIRYGPDWSVGARAMGLGTQEPTTTDPGAERLVATARTRRPLLFPGRLTVRVVGGQTTLEDEPTAARVRRVAVRLVDEAGAVVVSYTIRVGDGSGETVTITPLPPMEVLVGEAGAEAWTTINGWTSDLTGLGYQMMEEATAAERIAQQGQNLRCLLAEVEGLVGPESALVVPGRTGSPSASWSPFAEPVEMIAAGLEIDALRGTTRGVWVERVTDAGAAAVGGAALKGGDDFPGADGPGEDGGAEGL